MAEQHIEETATEETKPTNKAYPMDMNPIEVKVNIYPTLEKAHYTTHTFRKPTFEEEEARERTMPLITSDAGKVEGADASSMTIDDEPANVALYDKIIQSVSGYALQKGEKPSKEALSMDTMIETPDGAKSIKELIPVSHKSTAISGMFTSKFDIDVPETEEFSFTLGGGREWRIKHEIGGGEKREDGTLSPADFTLYHTLREPTEMERKKFRTRAVAALTLRNPKTGQVTERRSTNLKVMKELYDALILSVEGATIEGKEIRVSDASQLEMIPASFKKSVVIRLFNFLEADLGN